jgi:hypothetical protein
MFSTPGCFGDWQQLGIPGRCLRLEKLLEVCGRCLEQLLEAAVRGEALLPLAKLPLRTSTGSSQSRSCSNQLIPQPPRCVEGVGAWHCLSRSGQW